jgi:glycosyltransferase involved in cell wall biosynthesis
VSALPPDFALLQVVPELETGGAEQTTVDIAAAVVRASGRALVASRGGRMAGALAQAGGELRPMPAQSKNPLIIAANAARLVRIIRAEGVDLIHARSRAPAFSALWAAKATGIPFIATYHGVYEAHNGLKRWYNGVMTQGALTIANSGYTRDHIVAEHRVSPDRVVAIDRGVDLARFEPDRVTPERIAAIRAAWGLAADDRKVKILLAGRLTRWKGQSLLIEAAAQLWEAGERGFVILLAGDDQGRLGYRTELEAQIERLGLADAVRLVGHCDDMPGAYCSVDLAVAPSLKPEPFGRTAVEPQIMGRPVIAADHGAARETVVPGQTGWLAKPGDAGAWAQALRGAIALTPQQRMAMGATARSRAVRLYSAQAMCEATLAVYARLLEARG